MTSCVKINLNSYSSVLKADCGISTDGVNILKNYTNFNLLNSLVAVSGHTGAINSTGTRYKRIGDLVELILNVSFTYEWDGVSSQSAVVIGNLPLAATTDSLWFDSFTNFIADVFDFNGHLEVKNNQIILHTAVNFVEDDLYTIRGQIFYKIPEETLCIPCECFYKKSKFYASVGILLNSALLSRFTNRTALTFVVPDANIDVASQFNYSHRFGDMVHISLFIQFSYVVAPLTATETITLEGLPVDAITTAIYTNMGGTATTNTLLQILNATDLTVVHGDNGVAFLADTPYIISGQIVYNASSV